MDATQLSKIFPHRAGEFKGNVRMEGEGHAIMRKDVVHRYRGYSCSGELFERLSDHVLGVGVNKGDNVLVILMCREEAH